MECSQPVKEMLVIQCLLSKVPFLYAYKFYLNRQRRPRSPDVEPGVEDVDGEVVVPAGRDDVDAAVGLRRDSPAGMHLPCNWHVGKAGDVASVDLNQVGGGRGGRNPGARDKDDARLHLGRTSVESLVRQ